MNSKPFTAVHIVPTGIGASIGGFAGDAGPANALISQCVDLLIANPNVVNAASLHNIPKNLLYTEGYTINNFFNGNIALRPVNNNKIGVVFDKTIPENVLNININAINACAAIYGLDIVGYTITDNPVNVNYFLTEENISSGTINNPETLLKACSNMIDNGANALAIVCYFPDFSEEDLYAKGQSSDPVGGIESIISHLISYHFNIPCAHAPSFSYTYSLPSTEVVDPRAAAEYFSSSFLPCVLYGLNKAPQIIDISKKSAYDLTIEQIDLLITPFNCLGNQPVLSAIERNITILAIRDNETVLDVTAEKLPIFKKVIILNNYLEASGYIIALKSGLEPHSVLRPVKFITQF